MASLKGKGIYQGQAKGRALVTRMPMNFTAAFTKVINLLPGKRSEIQDRHHELYKKNISGKILVFPTCIGSTYTGMVLLELMVRKVAPCAMIVNKADSLLVSGLALAETWFDKAIPVVEYEGDDLFDRITNGDRLEVDGSSGRIEILG